MNFFSHKKAFTLIQLLVTIAIIGILSTILLSGIGPMRQEGRDARIIKSMDYLRTASVLYRQGKGSYENLCIDVLVESPTPGNPTSDIGILAKDIVAQGGRCTGGGQSTNDGQLITDDKNVCCYENDYNYCMKVQLNSGYWWCVDNTSTGKLHTPEEGFIGDCGAIDCVDTEFNDDNNIRIFRCNSENPIIHRVETINGVPTCQ